MNKAHPAREFLSRLTPPSQGHPSLELIAPEQIALDDLIHFMQNPVEYFFKQQLHVHFDRSETEIAEREHFSLDNLEKYWLRDELVRLDESQRASFFTEARLKGQLPAANFARLTENHLSARVQGLRTTLADYLCQTPQRLDIALACPVQGKTITLFGSLAPQYAPHILLWRAGGLRDKDKIKLWIYHLVLQATNTNANAEAVFYYLDKDRVEMLRFAPVGAEQAAQLLAHYIARFVQSGQQLDLLAYNNLDAYFARTKDGGEYQFATDPQKFCQIHLSALTQGDYADRYLARVLQQSSQLDYHAIHQHTLDCFELMQQSVAD